jgi:ubiquinone/menaquinone biosynthesis C-methylase UbiE
MKSDPDVIRMWDKSASYWEKHRDIIGGMFHPITEALIEDAQIGPGQAVLDVATGPGEPALSIAEFVGPSGAVAGIDPIPGMIAAARRVADARHFHNARFEVASADQVPFPDNHFDAVVCRFGVMFFPSPHDGVREMLRVLKPDRKIAFAVWNFGDKNPFHSILANIVDRYVSPEPLPPDAPDAFRFAERGKLLKILNEAGAARTSERLLQFNIEIPLSIDDYWALRWDISDKLRTKLSSVSPEQLASIRQEVSDDVAAYSTDGVIRFPAEVLVVSGYGVALRW